LTWDAAPAYAPAGARQATKRRRPKERHARRTAVRVDSGDFTLSSSGTIAGGLYALRTGAGADSLSSAGGVTLAFGLDPAVPLAPIRGVETLILADGTVLDLTVSGQTPVTDGQAFDIARTTSLAATPSALAVTGNLPMITWTARTDPLGANALQVLAARDGSWYAHHSPDPSLGRVLDGLAAGLDASGDPAANSGQLAPFNQTGSVATSVSGGSAFAATFAGRMQRLRGSAAGAGGLAPAGFTRQDMDPVETGAALDVRSAQDDSLEGLLGLRLWRDWDLGDCRLTPAVWGGWLHEWLDPDSGVTAAFSGAPGQTFTGGNNPVERDKARLGAGLETAWSSGMGSSLRLEGELGERSTDLSLALGLSRSFSRGVRTRP
jgi:hypothetical protein